MKRILIIGASGSGTSTVGRNLADKLNVKHIETDDLFWIPEFPPYEKFRSNEELEIIIQREVLSNDGWVMSGSPCGWGDGIISFLDIAVYLTVSTNIRIERIIQREKERFGSEIEEQGSLFKSHQEFLAWTRCYDTGGINGRTRTQHESWLNNLKCPVLRLEGEWDVHHLVSNVFEFIGAKTSN